MLVEMQTEKYFQYENERWDEKTTPNSTFYYDSNLGKFRSGS